MLQRRFIRHGRAYLLWSLAGFVVVQLVLGILIDQAWPAVRDPEYANKLRQFRELRAEEPDAPLVVALGSSRTLLGLQAANLRLTAAGRPALVYNFARPGCGPVLQLLTLRRLLADGVRPGRALVEVMPAFLNRRQGRLLEEKDLDGAVLQAPELVRACRFANQPWLLVKNWALGRALPCYRYGVELEQELPIETPRTGVDPNRGWRPHHTEVTPEERNFYTDLAKNQYDDKLTDFHLAAKPVQALHELLALCRRNGIEVAFVVTPEGTPFRALYDSAALPVIDAFLADLRRDWRAPVIDARDWIADEEFFDAHHLLPSGAQHFTDRLGTELEAAWAAPSPVVPSPSDGPTR
jgi:hypothetical protein